MTGGLTFAHLPGYRVVWRPFPLVQFEFWLERGGYRFCHLMDPLEVGLQGLGRADYRAPTDAEWQQAVSHFDRHERAEFERRVDERLAPTS